MHSLRPQATQSRTIMRETVKLFLDPLRPTQKHTVRPSARPLRPASGPHGYLQSWGACESRISTAETAREAYSGRARPLGRGRGP